MIESVLRVVLVFGAAVVAAAPVGPGSTAVFGQDALFLHPPVVSTRLDAPLALATSQRSLPPLESPGSRVTLSGTAPTLVSRACEPHSNAEVEQAADSTRGFVYEEWMGCQGIGFARSSDGGRHFAPAITLPGSNSRFVNSWDPALAVAPDGTLYAAFMRAANDRWVPFVAVSRDHGRTFSEGAPVANPGKGNWGDRDFLAVAPNSTVYLTWDFGPTRKDVTFVCAAGGSCGFSTGDLNAVIQWSNDAGKTWSRIVPVNPGFPFGGGDSAPLLVEPSGRIDVLYQGYRVINRATAALAPAHLFYSTSVDGGRTWSLPVRIGPADLTMSVFEWWIDDALARDDAGNLYATYDTQGTQDIGWLAFSTDHGSTWSALQRVTSDQALAAHITEVAGGPPGIAYVAWLSNSSTLGWTESLRIFSIDLGFLTGPIRLSGSVFGALGVWPGDTFGLTALANGTLAVSWGSGVSIRSTAPRSQIFERVLVFTME